MSHRKDVCLRMCDYEWNDKSENSDKFPNAYRHTNSIVYVRKNFNLKILILIDIFIKKNIEYYVFFVSKNYLYTRIKTDLKTYPSF